MVSGYQSIMAHTFFVIIAVKILNQQDTLNVTGTEHKAEEILHTLIIIILGVVVGYFYGSILFGGILAGGAAMIYTLIVFNSGDQIILGLTKAK